MGKPVVKKSKQTNRQIDSDTKSNSKQQTAEKADEHPEWLPDGWDMEVKTRKSGPNMGFGYKCYVDPSNRYKFYSKPEVLRYLKTTKDTNRTSKKKKCTSMHSPSKVEEKCTKKHSPREEEEKCTDKHSPSKEKEKYTNSNKHSPSKEEEKCTNSSKHSPSKVEEKCINIHSPSKEEEKCINMHSPSNVAGENSTVEDLPPGWIKEVKIRKKRNGNKKDWFYTDPVSGYVFHSKKDALRYIESGDIGKCAIKPSRRQIQDEDNLTPSPAAKRQKSKQSTPMQKIVVAKELVESLELSDVNNSRKGQDVSVTSGMLVAPDTSSGSVVKMHSLEDGAASSPEMKKTSKAVLKDESLKVNHSIHSISKEDFNVGRRFSPRLAGVEPVKLVDNVINNQTILVPKRNLRKNRTTLGPDMENKSSQHFNGVPEIEQPEAMNTGNTLSEVVFKEQQHQLERDKIEDNKPEIHTNSKKSSKKKEPRIPCRASKRLAGSEHGLMNSISCEKTSKYDNKKSKEVVAELQQSEGVPVTDMDRAPINGEPGNKRGKSPEILPGADNQLEQLEVDDEKSEPQLSFAFHYSWSDPCLEFAINTLTGVLPPVENSVDNGSSTFPETDIQKTPLDTVSGRSRDSQNNSVDNGPTTVHETDIQKTLFDKVTRRSKDIQNNIPDNVTRSRDKNSPVQSNKSKRKKEVKVPMRLSKRLAGVEPEAIPSDKALEYSIRKSCKEEAASTVLLTNGASDHLCTGKETKLTRHVSDGMKTEGLGDSSRKSGKSYDAQTFRKEQQLEKVEAKNTGDDRLEPDITLPFGESWSDPCLEFAFKTLTGDLPVDSAADIFKVTTPDVDDLRNNELHGRLTTSINGKDNDNSNQSPNKKECNTNMVGQQPEWKTSSTSGKNVLKFTTGESHSHEGNIIRSLNGEPLYVEAENTTQILHHSRANAYSQIQEEPLKRNEQISEGVFGTTEQPSPFQTETLNHDNAELQFCESFMNSWSDPCLEFAFKTLTGEIPVEQTLGNQGCIQEPANCHEGRDGGSALPDFGSSSFSQSDFSFHYDTGVKSMSMPGQNSSMSSSFPSLSLQGCPGVDPQQHYSQFNTDFQRR